jgi:hypothetical protein
MYTLCNKIQIPEIFLFPNRKWRNYSWRHNSSFVISLHLPVCDFPLPPIIAIIFARYLFCKDTEKSALFEEQRELMLMTFPSRVNKSDGIAEVKAIPRLLAYVSS